MSRSRSALLLLLAAVVPACRSGTTAHTAWAPEGPGEPAIDPVLAESVLHAVRDYTAYPRVSDCPAWSPISCSLPPPAGALVSASDDGGTHGRKLYHLFAKERAAYAPPELEGERWKSLSSAPEPPRVPAPIGQVLVKEAWEPVPVGAVPENEPRSGLLADHAAAGGRLYRRGDMRGLFVMLKLDPATPGTDAGWVYATVSPDRARVTSAGRVASCMGCHVEAEHDRQFGLPDDWATMRERP